MNKKNEFPNQPLPPSETERLLEAFTTGLDGWFLVRQLHAAKRQRTLILGCLVVAVLINFLPETKAQTQEQCHIVCSTGQCDPDGDVLPQINYVLNIDME